MPDYVFRDHARYEMARRHISEWLVRRVLDDPDQVLEIRPGRMVYQSIVEAARPNRRYLLRVFVDVDQRPSEVVTAYSTSRIERYWRSDE